MNSLSLTRQAAVNPVVAKSWMGQSPVHANWSALVIMAMTACCACWLNRVFESTNAGRRLYTVILNSIFVHPLSSNLLQDIDDVWTASELATSQGKVMPTGSPELDAQLPGGGWPVGALVEILQTQSGQNDWRLLLPALAKTAGVLVLVGAPHAPFASALAGQGLNPHRLLCIPTDMPSNRMWAAEQALRCTEVAAVLAWLPLARAEQLRRLQMSAAEHAKLLFVMRPAKAQNESSPAVLRLITSNPLQGDALLVSIFKRRGPPFAQTLALAARPAQLRALLAAAGWGASDEVSNRLEQASNDALATSHSGDQRTLPGQGQAKLLDFRLEGSHALDRTATAAA